MPENSPPPLGRNDVEIISREAAYQGYFRIDRYRLKHRLFEGGWSGEMEREVFERGHVAGVLPYDPVLDRLVVIEQFRIGALAAMDSPWPGNDFSPWLLEFVAGVIDEGETPEEVARRETIEETGCEIQDMIPVYRYLSTAGSCSEYVFLYCGRVDAANAGGIYGLTEEHENIRVLSVPSEKAFQWLDEGRIVNAKALIALQWFRMNREKLRRLWNPS
ncbi:MAG: ADP-ribose diphosphatase [Rhodospirillales bacterium]|nr:ADP-ribose diphosphatase [Rhodospirillales bacterium]